MNVLIRPLCALLSVSFCFLLFSCRAHPQEDAFADTVFFAMDTVITLRLPSSAPASVLRACEAQVHAAEQQFSRTVPDSEVSRFNESTGGIPVSAEFSSLLARALTVSEATDGAFDPTVEPLTVLWNITGEHPQVPKTQDIAAALASVGYRQLALRDGFLEKTAPHVHIDAGGCAKGYACQQAVSFLSDAGISFGLVSFGGNVGVFGQKPDGSPYTVGIRHPDRPDASAGYLSVSDGFVSVSGDYERYFEADGVRYHHILDPKTGYPSAGGVRSAAVWSDDAVTADALSTALFVGGADAALRLYEDAPFSFEAVLYLSDGTTVITPGLKQTYRHAAEDYAPPAP